MSDKPSALETFLGILLPGSVGHVLDAMGNSGEDDWGSESKRKSEPVSGASSSLELMMIGNRYRTEARIRARNILDSGGYLGWIEYRSAYNELVDERAIELNKLDQENRTLRKQLELTKGVLLKARDIIKEQDNVISALSTRHISGSKGN